MNKKALFINRHAPHGTVYAQEKLQMAMVFGAFELKVSMLFLDDGVYSLVKNQQTRAIGFHDFSKQYTALEQYYEIKDIFVGSRSMCARELTAQNLLIPVTVVTDDEIKVLLHNQDIIINV